MDNTWGLSWSGRWHKIDATQTAAISLCGIGIYSQDTIKSARKLNRLKLIVADHDQLAPVCRKCDNKFRATAPPTGMATSMLNLPWSVQNLTNDWALQVDRQVIFPWGIVDCQGVIIGRFDTQEQAQQVILAIDQHYWADSC